MNLEELESRISDSCNRSLRAALHKNLVEQTNCDSTTRILDAQRKWVHSRLTREERDVRQQLQQLQLEQKQHSELATGVSVSSDPFVCDVRSSEESEVFSVVDPDEIVNPYPITSRSKINSGSSSQQEPSNVSSSSQSIRNARSLNDFDGPRPWPGDLEAISSIRRGLKPPCRQRIEQQSWARSRSLKERPQSSALTRLHSVFRSKSMRDPDKARLSVSSSPDAGSPMGSGACSRSGSLKGPSNTPRKSEPFVDQRLRRSESLKTSRFTRRDRPSEVDYSCLEETPAGGALGNKTRPNIHSSNTSLAVLDINPPPPIATSNSSSGGSYPRSIEYGMDEESSFKRNTCRPDDVRDEREIAESEKDEKS